MPQFASRFWNDVISTLERWSVMAVIYQTLQSLWAVGGQLRRRATTRGKGCGSRDNRDFVGVIRMNKELSPMFVTRYYHVTTACWCIVGFMRSVYGVPLLSKFTIFPREKWFKIPLLPVNRYIRAKGEIILYVEWKIQCLHTYNPNRSMCALLWWTFALRSPLWRATLRWRQNGRDSVSNNQLRHCLLSLLFGRRSKKTSKLRVTGLCVGNSPGPVNSPHKGPVARKMFPFDDVIMILQQFWIYRARLLWQRLGSTQCVYDVANLGENNWNYGFFSYSCSFSHMRVTFMSKTIRGRRPNCDGTYFQNICFLGVNFMQLWFFIWNRFLNSGPLPRLYGEFIYAKVKSVVS